MEKTAQEDLLESDVLGERAQSALGFLVTDISRLLRQRVQSDFVGTELTLTKARVLVYVARFDGIRQTELAKMLEMQLVQLVKLVDQLIDENLLVRKPDPIDRRTNQLFLPANAEPLLLEIRSVLDCVDREAWSGLSSEEQRLVCNILIKVRRNLIR